MTNAETNDTVATVAAQGATVAPEKASSKKVAKRTKSAPKSQKKATGAKGRKAKAGKKAAGAGRAQSKGATILEMIALLPVILEELLLADGVDQPLERSVDPRWEILGFLSLQGCSGQGRGHGALRRMWDSDARHVARESCPLSRERPAPAWSFYICRALYL